MIIVEVELFFVVSIQIFTVNSRQGHRKGQLLPVFIVFLFVLEQHRWDGTG